MSRAYCSVGIRITVFRCPPLRLPSLSSHFSPRTQQSMLTPNVANFAPLRHISTIKRIINATAIELTRPLPFDIRPAWGNPTLLLWAPYTQQV